MNRRGFLQLCLGAILTLISKKLPKDIVLDAGNRLSIEDLAAMEEWIDAMMQRAEDVGWTIIGIKDSDTCPTRHPVGNTMNIDEWISAEKQRAEAEGSIWIA